MSIYGEGQHRNPVTGERARAGSAPRRSSPSASGTCSPTTVRRSSPSPRPRRSRSRPTSVYAVGKRDHEELTLAVGAAYGIPSVALRFFNVYGAGSRSATRTRASLRSSPPAPDGQRAARVRGRRADADFVDVRDIARACELALTGPGAAAGGESALARPTSVLDVATVLADGLGLDIEPEIVGSTGRVTSVTATRTAPGARSCSASRRRSRSRTACVTCSLALRAGGGRPRRLGARSADVTRPHPVTGASGAPGRLGLDRQHVEPGTAPRLPGIARSGRRGRTVRWSSSTTRRTTARRTLCASASRPSASSSAVPGRLRRESQHRDPRDDGPLRLRAQRGHGSERGALERMVAYVDANPRVGALGRMSSIPTGATSRPPGASRRRAPRRSGR